MRPSLRFRILLTLLPLFVLLAVLGSAGVFLLDRLAGRIDLILRENYDSVIAMERLNEALERIDSSQQFALAGRRQKAREQYDQNWKLYDDALKIEQDNITLPGEEALVRQLEKLTARYRALGDKFYQRPVNDPQAHNDYFGPDGLLDTFKEIKRVSGDILRINQQNMEDANRDARATAADSLGVFGLALGAAAILAGLAAWRTIHTILQPIRAVTQSALAIGNGNLDQLVPVVTRDELGQLADAFNLMARQLRQYRQSDYTRLLSAQRTSQATIDAFPDPVLVVDAEGRIEMANPAAQRVLGVAAPAPTAARIPWQPPAELRQPLLEGLGEQRAYLPEGFDRSIALRMDQQEHSFLPRVLPIQDPYGNTLGAAVLLQDVTRFRLLDEVKNDLAATVSHELKTPLTSLRLALHLLLEESVGPLSPKQTELLLDARDNAERLLARVNSLLDLARLEQKRDQLDMRPEPPRDLLKAAADGIRPRAEDRKIDVVIDAASTLPAVAADAQRLGRALDNLLDNALVYTESGGRITLGATAADDNVVLTVADTGSGISPEHLPHVFDKFFRVPGQSTSGTGLGLAIVREIVQAHGGQVTCTSSRGQGTVFHITLPAWNAQARAEGGASSPKGGGS